MTSFPRITFAILNLLVTVSNRKIRWRHGILENSRDGGIVRLFLTSAWHECECSAATSIINVLREKKVLTSGWKINSVLHNNNRWSLSPFLPECKFWWGKAAALAMVLDGPVSGASTCVLQGDSALGSLFTSLKLMMNMLYIFCPVSHNWPMSSSEGRFVLRPSFSACRPFSLRWTGLSLHL